MAMDKDIEINSPLNAINDPGVRDNGNGTFTIQMSKRSTQLNDIAEEFKRVLGGRKGSQGMVISTADIRRLLGYCKTLGIIADELQAAGK
jgi:hypothetical protein